MFISVWKKSHNYAKLANKTLEDLGLGASGRTDEETTRKENPVDLPFGKLRSRVKFLGTALGDWSSWLARECSVMSTRDFRRPLISTVVGRS